MNPLAQSYAVALCLRVCGLRDPPPLHYDCIVQYLYACLSVCHKNGCLAYDPMSSIHAMIGGSIHAHAD